MSSSNEDNDNDIIIAAVEGGGTSFCVAIAKFNNAKANNNGGGHYQSPPSPITILHRTEVDSSHDNPQRTIKECATFLKKHKPINGYHALGIATFGPVGVNENRIKEYGTILSSSPKQSWRNIDLLTPLQKVCKGSRQSLAMKVETDVNAPALAEYLNIIHNNHDTDNDISSLAYITVGTGVGVGLVVNGKPVHGRMHPELGHITVQPLVNDTFTGYSWGIEKCPFMGINTVEGIASSVALTERLQQQQKQSSTATTNEQFKNRNILSTLSDDNEIWDHTANAIANLCATLLLFSIEKIIIGGGIMKRKGLLQKIHQRTIQLINGYLDLPSIDNMSTIITTSQYGNNAGLNGAIVLAQHAYYEQQKQQNQKEEQQKSSITTTSTLFNEGFVHGVILGSLLAAAACFTIIGRQRGHH